VLSASLPALAGFLSGAINLALRLLFASGFFRNFFDFGKAAALSLGYFVEGREP